MQLLAGGPNPPDEQIATPMKVSRLIVEDERRWNEEMINEILRRRKLRF